MAIGSEAKFKFGPRGRPRRASANCPTSTSTGRDHALKICVSLPKVKVTGKERDKIRAHARTGAPEVDPRTAGGPWLRTLYAQRMEDHYRRCSPLGVEDAMFAEQTGHPMGQEPGHRPLHGNAAEVRAGDPALGGLVHRLHAQQDRPHHKDDAVLGLQRPRSPVGDDAPRSGRRARGRGSARPHHPLDDDDPAERVSPLLLRPAGLGARGLRPLVRAPHQPALQLLHLFRGRIGGALQQGGLVRARPQGREVRQARASRPC